MAKVIYLKPGERPPTKGYVLVVGVRGLRNESIETSRLRTTIRVNADDLDRTASRLAEKDETGLGTIYVRRP